MSAVENIQAAVAELVAEKDGLLARVQGLDAQIAHLNSFLTVAGNGSVAPGPTKRRGPGRPPGTGKRGPGRPPKSATAKSTPRRKGTGWTRASRKATSVRMKLYWANEALKRAQKSGDASAIAAAQTRLSALSAA
jgi:hypothetical protein